MAEFKCEDCTNHKFDELWGEYICLIRQHTIYNPQNYANCEFYKKQKETKNKKDDQ